MVELESGRVTDLVDLSYRIVKCEVVTCLQTTGLFVRRLICFPMHLLSNGVPNTVSSLLTSVMENKHQHALQCLLHDGGVTTSRPEKC